VGPVVRDEQKGCARPAFQGNPFVRLRAKNCGFAPAALGKRSSLSIRLKAKNCGFAPAAFSNAVDTYGVEGGRSATRILPILEDA